MSPRATPTEEPDGGNLLVRIWRGAGVGNLPAYSTSHFSREPTHRHLPAPRPCPHWELSLAAPARQRLASSVDRQAGRTPSAPRATQSGEGAGRPWDKVKSFLAIPQKSPCACSL
jgi:hypothetical protein